jgi:RNA polymerase sigma-70 factor, ECF subfamily
LEIAGLYLLPSHLYFMALKYSDDEVLKLASSGDQEAFGELYDRYIDKIYSYIYYRTGNKQDAEDIASKVFSRAMKHITNYQDRGVPFSAWLYRIAHNLVANWHRDNSRKQEVVLEDYNNLQSKSEYPESQVLRFEEEAAILKLIQQLPEDRQQLILLKFVEHYSNTEIGVIMGKTEGAIKSLYHRTLTFLRDEINQEEFKKLFSLEDK